MTVHGTDGPVVVKLAAAARHQDRIAGLLLAHPPDPLRRPRHNVALLEFAERRSDPDLAVRWMFAFAFLGLTSWEGIAPPLWLRLPSLTRAAIEAATPAATVRRKLALLFRDDPGLPPPAAGIPVEILAGAWDLVAPLPGARRIAARIPGAKLSVLGYSGHAGAFARPRAHGELVIAAMKRLARIEP
jgi:pimeloyl-ACP methyl ester carboxylesterase